MLSTVRACALVGLDGFIIEVQTDFNPRASIPQFVIVGQADNAIKESRERVKSAIRNSGMQFPNKAYVVNLNPASLPKHSTAYDLAIAMGVLAATDQAPLPDLENALFIGELSLNGEVCHVNGILSMVYAAAQAGIRRVYLPAADAPQAALVSDVDIYPVKSLGQLIEHLYGLDPIPVFRSDPSQLQTLPDNFGAITDFSAVKGQEQVKRALEIAAAGNHNLLMIGSPGTGKTLLARAMPGILPALTFAEALEITRIYSVADLLEADHPLIASRPFRAPHHTISQAGLVGGGSTPRPGETTLAHRGVLFLDEAVEFAPRALEALRQPIEDKIVTISRAGGSMTFPASFLLVLAMNPCPCGYHGDPVHTCSCSPTAISKYQARLSGPLLDRIDIHIYVPQVDYDKLMGTERGETSAVVRERVEQARARQRERYTALTGVYANSDIGVNDIEEYCAMTPAAKALFETTIRRLNFSARSYHRMLKLARTIADLGNSMLIDVPHAAEAIQYRARLMMSEGRS